MRRLLVTGSRDWDDSATVENALNAAWLDLGARTFAEPGRVTLVHGDARGLDRMAASIWLRLGYGEVEAKPADWGGHGKRAGFVRNSEMVALGPLMCLAFIKNQSRGAAMCADLAETAGILTRRWTA